jgi:hypothetical protein
MNDTPHRNLQNLPKIGPVFSTIDEKQRLLSEQILDLRIKPELKLKINLAIPGLDRKKDITMKNVSTYRFTQKLSHYGKEGWKNVWIMPNSIKFLIPFCGGMFYYFVMMNRMYQVYNANETLNYEYETCYVKMQTQTTYYTDVITYMA